MITKIKKGKYYKDGIIFNAKVIFEISVKDIEIRVNGTIMTKYLKKEFVKRIKEDIESQLAFEKD